MATNKGEEILAEALANSFDGGDSGGSEFNSKKSKYGTPSETPPPADPAGNSSQWALGGDGKFTAVGATVKTLPPGVYSPYATMSETGLELMPISSDGIYPLPDMATQDVLKEVETFWNNEKRYRNHNLLYKRGILLWGPPGSGKTVTVKLLTKEIIKRGGICIIASNTGLTSVMLKKLRSVEPNRNVILLFEDIDEIIRYNGEANVLSILDGEHNIDNVLNLATTNFPDRLGARIINRPSRFDSRVFVDMPQGEARAFYLKSATQGDLSKKDLDKWTKDTEGLSIAHLRELVAAVYCLGQSYDSVITRLKAMSQAIKAREDGFAAREMGFGKKK